MSYLYNGQQIRIMQPVHSISVNKNRVVVNHVKGTSNIRFANVSECKAFLTWLVAH
ncbi:hypothetical protein [Thalassotalea sediminis]|uniref:hypothetical protein n=1 Tax=Thalassotalea sediminis TaxID=1759089 RepID=UPI002572BBC6|nr:hypothetical protein [Thalassotalea sediminis]